MGKSRTPPVIFGSFAAKNDSPLLKAGAEGGYAAGRSHASATKR